MQRRLKPYEALIEAYRNAKADFTVPVDMFNYLHGVLAGYALMNTQYGTLADLEALFMDDIRYMANQVNQQAIAQTKGRKIHAAKTTAR